MSAMDPSTEYILFSQRELLRKVALVVQLTDGFTGSPPTPEALVFIRDSRYPAIRNLSGYYVFIRIPRQETFKIEVTCPGFFPGMLTLSPGDVALLDPGSPVVNFTLEPLPSYPFPGGTTLVRGMVHDSGSRPVPAARVEAEGTSISTHTTHKGEFVLFFTGITDDDILVAQGKKLIAVAGKSEIKINAQIDSRTGTYTVPAVPEGETTVLPDPIKTG